MKEPAIVIDGLAFYDTPSEIEGSPYWVDLWADVNGYKIGLQIKPKSYRSCNISIYTGKARKSYENGHKKFKDKYGGKVIVVTIDNGMVDMQSLHAIRKEIIRLGELPPGPFAT
ncbi:MAG: hypothetical protein QXI12_06355 [Candidatus Methanomethyliaceae archaeon]